MGWLRRLFSGLKKSEDSETEIPHLDKGTPTQPKSYADTPLAQGIDVGGVWAQMLDDPEVLQEHFGVNSRAELDQILSDADRAMQGQAIRSAVIDGHTCPTCRELDGKTVNLDSPEFEQFMPPRGCTAKECRCEYIVSGLDHHEPGEADESNASIDDGGSERQWREYAPPKLEHSDAAHCPYCSAEIRPAPRRKTKCRACGSYVFVRTRQELFPVPYLTQSQTVAVDRFAKLAELGVSVNELKTMVTSANTTVDDSTYLEGIYTLADRLAAQMSDRRERSAILREIAMFRRADGGDWLTPLRASEREVLLWMQQEGIDQVSVDAEECCEVCRKHHQRRFTVAEALQTMVVPDRDCVGEPLCICSYSDL